MNPRFPLKDVTVREVDEPRSVRDPAYADSFWQMNQNEFAMQVEGIGRFYARNGSEVEYAPAPEASRESLELYLNGSVSQALYGHLLQAALPGTEAQTETGILLQTGVELLFQSLQLM